MGMVNFGGCMRGKGGGLWEDSLRCETGFVDAIVDVIVGPFICLVDLLLQLLGIQNFVLVD